MRLSKTCLLSIALLLCTLPAISQSKPKLTLDEFFNSVSYPTVALSPDGHSVVIATERADWDQKIFRLPCELTIVSTPLSSAAGEL